MSDKSDKSKKKRLAETKRTKSSQMFGMRGLSVRDVVLPWESKEEFKQLHRELTEELSPQGRMEEDIVFDVARLHWHKYRLLKMLRTAALKDTFFVELMESGRKSWPGIRKYLREQDQDFRTIRGNLSNLFSELAEAVRKELAHDHKGMEKEEVQAREQRVSDITKAMSEHLIPMLQAIDAGPSAGKTFEQAYLPEVLERILKCEAAINSQIDKSLNRLVRSKEYKRMYGVHAPVLPQVDSPDTVAELAELTSDN
jgi:hypothetical protein